MSVEPYRHARAALLNGDAVPALSLLAASHGDPEVRIHALTVLGPVSAGAAVWPTTDLRRQEFLPEGLPQLLKTAALGG